MKDSDIHLRVDSPYRNNSTYIAYLMAFKHRIALFRGWTQQVTHRISCFFRVHIKRKKSFYNPQHHQGDLPIRVLAHNVTDWLESVSPEFFQRIKDEIQNRGLDPGIGYNIDRTQIMDTANIRAASIGRKRKINIYETFNAYLWCICYSLFVAFDEGIQKPQLRGKYDGTLDVRNKHIEKAIAVFNYGMSLKDTYSSWDKSLPNPEEYKCEDAYYVERANSIFISAMYLILSHEIGHSYFNHVAYRTATATQSLSDELEADNFAIDQVMSCPDPKIREVLKYGAVCGMCALLFLSPKLKKRGGNYPDADNRIRNVME